MLYYPSSYLLCWSTTKPSCHIPFLHAFFTFLKIFEELTTVDQTKVSSSKIHTDKGCEKCLQVDKWYLLLREFFFENFYTCFSVCQGWPSNFKTFVALRSRVTFSILTLAHVYDYLRLVISYLC